MTARALRLEGIGEALRTLRGSLSLADLASRLGCDKATLCLYENNQRSIPIEVLENVAEVLSKQKEAVVLFCLEYRYPALRKSQLGEAFQRINADLCRLREL